MNLIELLVLLLIAGVCGSVGQALAGVKRGGWLMSIVIGYVGALLGAWIARGLALPEPFAVSVGGTPFPILWSIVGSALFIALLGLLTPSSRGR